MTFAVVSNILTMIFCTAVLVQSVRLMRAFDAVKGGALTEVVHALDVSTGEARRVLGSLTDLLRGDLAHTSSAIFEGKAMIDELIVMTGIANAIAERIVDAAGVSNNPGPKVSQVPKTVAVPAVNGGATTAPSDLVTKPQSPKSPRRPRHAGALADKSVV